MKFKRDALYFVVIILLLAFTGQIYYDYQYKPKLNRDIQVFYNKQTDANLLVIDAIDNAEQYVHFSIYTFTRKDIKDALLGAKYRGLDVRGVTDKEQLERIPEQRKIITELVQYGIPVFVQDHTAIMHLKMLVTDKEFLSGSYNWTTSGTQYNDEVISIGTDPETKQQYDRVMQELFLRYSNNQIVI